MIEINDCFVSMVVFYMNVLYAMFYMNVSLYVVFYVFAIT